MAVCGVAEPNPRARNRARATLVAVVGSSRLDYLLMSNSDRKDRSREGMTMTKKAKEIPVKLARTEREAAPMTFWETDFPFRNTMFRNPFDLMKNFFTNDFENLMPDYRFNFNMPRLLENDPFYRFDKEVFDFVPPFEMFERDGKWIVKAELPGMLKEDIDVEINDEFLTLKGKKENKFEEKKDNFYRSEFTYGDFYRRIPIPEGVETKDAKAVFNNGILEITFAAPHLALKGKKLEITEAKPKAMTAGK